MRCQTCGVAYNIKSTTTVHDSGVRSLSGASCKTIGVAEASFDAVAKYAVGKENGGSSSLS